MDKLRITFRVWPVLVHSARTAVVAVASLLAARFFRLPEAYWATVTSLVITQSSLGAALQVSWQRFIGTALGAAVSALVLIHFGGTVLVFGICVFVLGLIAAAIRSDRSAFRFGGVTMAIVMLVPRTEPAWRIAFHRFAEVGIHRDWHGADSCHDLAGEEGGDVQVIIDAFGRVAGLAPKGELSKRRVFRCRR